MERLKQIKELLVDLYGCAGDLDDADLLTSVLTDAARAMDSQVIKTIAHKFSPTGTTVILILAETHISIHTWPEYNYAALDIFICSDEIDPETGWQVVQAALAPSSFDLHALTRIVR